MLQFVFNGISAGLGVALLALGFALIYRPTGVFHIAHAAVFTTSAYAAYWALHVYPSMATAGIASIAVGCSTGLMLEWAVYRPLAVRQASPLAVLVSSFGAYFAVVHLIALVAGSEAKTLGRGLASPIRFAGTLLTPVQAGQAVVGILGMLAVFMYLRFTRTGQWTRALASNRTLLLTLGVNEPRLRALLFLLGSSLAAAAGLLTALDIGIHPQMGFGCFLMAAVAVILAGPDRFMAAGWAAVGLGVAQNLALAVLPAIWMDSIVSALLLVALLCRREALVGTLPSLGDSR